MSFDELAFDQWFIRRFPKGTFGYSMQALEQAFREVVFEAWIAAQQFERDESSS